MTYIRAYVFFLNTFINKLHNVPQISCRKWYFVFFFHLSVISSNNWIRNFLKKCIFLCFQSNTQYGNCRKVLSQSFRKNSVKSTHLVFYFALQLGTQLFSRNFCQMRVNFSFFHIVWHTYKIVTLFPKLHTGNYCMHAHFKFFQQE